MSPPRIYTEFGRQPIPTGVEPWPGTTPYHRVWLAVVASACGLGTLGSWIWDKPAANTIDFAALSAVIPQAGLVASGVVATVGLAAGLIVATLIRRNIGLNQRVVFAEAMAGDVHEQVLRRMGADLHDGPAQLIGLALLYYDSPPPGQAPSVTRTPEHFKNVRGLLEEALKDIRNISADLAPPELDRLTSHQALGIAITNHERLTAVAVNARIGDLPSNLSARFNVCLYRFIQEGLINAFRHAKGANVSITTHLELKTLSITIVDDGPGFDRSKRKLGLGLAGLAHRIEAIGGTFQVISSPGHGTQLIANFDAQHQGEGYDHSGSYRRSSDVSRWGRPRPQREPSL